MKKILFHLFLLASLFMAACHDDNGGPSSIVIDKDQQNQTAYADDTEKTIRFEATEAWHTEVDYTATKATETVEKWVSLDPASGEAGEITIKLALSTNYTGTDRKATIHIICGGTTITVIIEQKGETENGEVPDEDSPADGVRKISEIITSTDGEPNHIVFTYDEQGRVQEYSLYKEISGQKKTEYVTTLTYSEDRIVKKTQTYNDSYTTGTTTYSLSEGRIGKARAETDNFDCDTWYYDSEGNMTKYIERYTITMGSVDQEGNTGATVEVLDSTVTTYIWQNGVVKTMHYYPEDNVSNDIITSEFEYYDLDEIRPLPSVIKLQYYPEELAGEDLTFFGYNGNVPARFIKKVTTSGDRWNKDNGTTTYRYVTDSKGYVVQIYSKWESAQGKTDAEEKLECEIIYE